MDKRYKINKTDKYIFIKRRVCIMDKKNLKSLDLSKLNSKKSIIISTKDALKDVTPINWSDEVLSGKKKVLVEQN